MNLTDDEVLKFQKGTPILLDDICAIYPVKIGEIVDIGYSIFQKYLGILTTSKPPMKDIEDQELRQIMEQLTDFQYILFMASTDLQINKALKGAFKFLLMKI